MTKYELTLTKDYAPDWGLTDAIRELFQNALDQEIINEKNTMFWNYENNVFKVGNAKSTLKTKSLLLGSTTKVNDNDTIGQFGEGYKIATLVLTRLGKKVNFYNYGARELWTAKIGYSKRYETELLIFNVDKKYPWYKIPDNDLTIEVEGITEDEMITIINSNLHMQNYESIKCEDGEILTDIDKRGKMYVNGLYISEVLNFNYGYNFKPSAIKLDRDRKLIRQFDLQWQTSRMWSSLDDNDDYNKLASDLIKINAPDVSYIHSSKSTTLSKTNKRIKDDFFEKYGSNSVPVSTQSEAEQIPSTHKPIIVDSLVKVAIESNEDYEAPKPIYIPTFLDKVELWLMSNGEHIDEKYRNELELIIFEEKNKNQDEQDDYVPF